MFDFERMIRSLDNFNDLDQTRQFKAIEVIVSSSGFRNWFFGVGGERRTNQQINLFFEKTTNPIFLKVMHTLIKDISLDRTASIIIHTIVQNAVGSANVDLSDASRRFKNGEMDKDDAKDLRDLSDQYNQILNDINDVVNYVNRRYINNMARAARIDFDLAATCYYCVPEPQYAPKYRMSIFLGTVLDEIYNWVSLHGMANISYVNWTNLFSTLFGDTLSAAMNALLESKAKMESYAQTKYFGDVCNVWDSITEWSMREINNASDAERNKMIELYMKKSAEIAKNNPNYNTRVSVNDIRNGKMGNSFRNLAASVAKFVGIFDSAINGNKNTDYYDETRNPRDLPHKQYNTGEGNFKARNRKDEAKTSQQIRDEYDPYSDLLEDGFKYDDESMTPAEKYNFGKKSYPKSALAKMYDSDFGTGYDSPFYNEDDEADQFDGLIIDSYDDDDDDGFTDMRNYNRTRNYYN